MSVTPFAFDLPPRLLAGPCLFLAIGGELEVELMETQSLQRSVVYLKDGDSLVVFIPRGEYGIWLRQLDSRHVATLNIFVMNIWDRISFFTKKFINLLKRGPFIAINAFIGFLRRRGRVTAAKIESQSNEAVLNVTHRDLILPSAVNTYPSISIIISTKIRADLLRACVGSLDRLRELVTELIVVDNGAVGKDMLELLDELRVRPNTTVLRMDVPFNFSRLCNAGANLAKHEFLLFLNDDIEASNNNWLTQMLAYAVRPDVGIVGARLLYPSGDLQHAGIASHFVPGPGHPWIGAPRHVWEVNPLVMQSGEVDAVTGACLLIRRSLFWDLNGFDEGAFAITLNDVDLCLRVRKLGLKVIYAAEAELFHKESQSRRSDDHPSQRLRRQNELKSYLLSHGVFARNSVFYPHTWRRDGSL